MGPRNVQRSERPRRRRRFRPPPNGYIRAENLTGYGAVAHGLAAELDPALEQMARAFERLAKLAGEGAGQ